MTKRGNPRDRCPVCGHKHLGRRCSPRVLAAIDGAHERGDEPSPLADLTNRSISDRLSAGFAILDSSEDGDEYE